MTDRRDNVGLMWVVDKGDNPRRPDWRGSFTVGGVAYVLAGWKVTRQDGRDVVSLKLELADGANVAMPPREAKPRPPQQSFRFTQPSAETVKRLNGRKPQPRGKVVLADDPIPF
jgi:hypothetical protein